jgi:hypothetical protein
MEQVLEELPGRDADAVEQRVQFLQVEDEDEESPARMRTVTDAPPDADMQAGDEEETEAERLFEEDPRGSSPLRGSMKTKSHRIRMPQVEEEEAEDELFAEEEVRSEYEEEEGAEPAFYETVREWLQDHRGWEEAEIEQVIEECAASLGLEVEIVTTSIEYYNAQ